MLITDLVQVNKEVSAYVLRALDADAHRAEPTTPADEHRLGTHLIELGNELRARATERATGVRAPGTEQPRIR